MQSEKFKGPYRGTLFLVGLPSKSCCWATWFLMLSKYIPHKPDKDEKVDTQTRTNLDFHVEIHLVVDFDGLYYGLVNFFIGKD